jgi:hypothetical protein
LLQAESAHERLQRAEEWSNKMFEAECKGRDIVTASMFEAECEDRDIVTTSVTGGGEAGSV